MNTEKLLLNMNSSLVQRSHMAQKILDDDIVISEVIAIVQNNMDLSLKALMALEVLSRDHFEKLQKYIPALADVGKLCVNSASRRYLSKIYGQAIQANAKTDHNVYLTSKVKKQIIELSFFWLISNEETAVKMFSMQNLFDLRHEEIWISEELKAIIEKQFPVSSQGFKPRATKILRKL